MYPVIELHIHRLLVVMVMMASICPEWQSGIAPPSGTRKCFPPLIWSARGHLHQMCICRYCKLFNLWLCFWYLVWKKWRIYAFSYTNRNASFILLPCLIVKVILFIFCVMNTLIRLRLLVKMVMTMHSFSEWLQSLSAYKEWFGVFFFLVLHGSSQKECPFYILQLGKNIFCCVVLLPRSYWKMTFVPYYITHRQYCLWWLWWCPLCPEWHAAVCCFFTYYSFIKQFNWCLVLIWE